MRYLLFSGWDYYPSGGANDLKGLFATEAEAVDYFLANIRPTGDTWAHVYDIETQAIGFSWARYG